MRGYGMVKAIPFPTIKKKDKTKKQDRAIQPITLKWRCKRNFFMKKVCAPVKKIFGVLPLLIMHSDASSIL